MSLERLEVALGDVERMALDAKARVEAQVARRPYATLAAALGAGYVLGGGLFTPLTARVVRAGARLLVLPLLQQELAAAAQEAAGLAPRPGTPA